MFTFNCAEADKNGDDIPGSGHGEVEAVLFDGYAFGDRLLEGVMFRMDRAGVVSPNDKRDFVGLDLKHWLKLATEHGHALDIGACPREGCTNDVVVSGKPG